METPAAQQVFPFYHAVTRFPRVVIALCVLGILAGAAFLPRITKDIRSDAFLAPDNPALVYKNRVKEQFGLSDPLVIVLRRDAPGGIFVPEVLALVQQLTDRLADLPNVDSSQIVSLATQKNMVGSDLGLDVFPFLEELPETPAEAQGIREAIKRMPLYEGSLVSRDGTATVVVVEVLDELAAPETYRRVMDLIADLPGIQGLEFHVAGEGAIIGYLGSYVDADARQLVPLTAIIIFLVIVFAFGQLGPALLSCVVVAGTLVITMGTMAATGVAFYVVTNALPVILIGISVADSIHIYSHYFDLVDEHQDRDRRLIVIETMAAMWRPITLTSITTAAGFIGLYFAAYMPPFKYFGLFAALGVMVAWIYSMTFLPAAILLRPPRRKVHPAASDGEKKHFSQKAMTAIGRVTRVHSRAVIGVSAAILVVAAYLATHLVVDEDPIKIFHQDEPIFVADQLINRAFDGSNTLDIVIETPAPEGLFQPATLRRIEALQKYAATLPHVGGSVSIVDYLKQMNRVLNEDDPVEYRLPDNPDLVAQYFLLYSATSDPTDFEEEVDYDYKTANVRVYLQSGSYRDVKGVVKSLRSFIDREFAGTGVSATLSGRANLNFRWIDDLAKSHFASLIVALLLVLTVSGLLFRSVTAGLYTLIPVCAAVLLVYATMVLLGINLGMGTSMFAAVAVGLGIDFAIHTVERLRAYIDKYGGDMDAVFEDFYQSTGKALLLNFLAIASGFGVLMFSKIASLNWFGAIVVLAVASSFLASVTLLCALIKVVRPRFIHKILVSDGRYTV